MSVACQSVHAGRQPGLPVLYCVEFTECDVNGMQQWIKMIIGLDTRVLAA